MIPTANLITEPIMWLNGLETYCVDTLDKGMTHIPGQRAQRYHTTQNTMQFTTRELFISGISHLIFLDHGWPQVTETSERETTGSGVAGGGLLYILKSKLTHLKRPWCWERLKEKGEEDDRGWDGWMPSLTQWTWVWVISGSCWWTGRPGVLQSMGSQRVRHDWGDLAAAAAAAAAAIIGKQPKVSGIQFFHLWNGDNDSILTVSVSFIRPYYLGK